jgi:hypothetical protein
MCSSCVLHARLVVVSVCRSHSLTTRFYPPCCRPKLPAGSNSRLKLEVCLGMLADSTMAVEVALSEALLNWPYFQDLSLVGAAAWAVATECPAAVGAVEAQELGLCN